MSLPPAGRRGWWSSAWLGVRFGVRAIGTAQLQWSATYYLQKISPSEVKLTVQPGKLRGLRLSEEARLVADLVGEYLVSAAKQRAWTLQLSFMSSRQALSRALGGHFPGLLLPGSPDTEREALAMLSTPGAAKLPFGVAGAEADFARASELNVSIGTLRLPGLLGGGSLGASEA